MEITSLFKRNQGRNGLVGLEHARDGYAMAYVVDDARRGCRVELCEWLPSSGNAEADREELKAEVKRSGLGTMPCNYVLTDEQYQLNLVEAPNVPAAELHSALAWQIKDLLSFPVEEAILDVIALPTDVSRQERSKVYVASAHESIIQQAITDTRYVGLDLHSIDVFDMSLRNLIDLWGCDERGEALVVIHRGRGEIVMFRQQQLYLSRKFELDYQGGVDEPLPLPQLGLEIQRTLDYFERQMGQLLPKKIHITGQSVRLAKLSQEFQQSLAIPIELMAIHGYWFNHRDRGGVVDVNGLAAIGAALRMHLGQVNTLEATA